MMFNNKYLLGVRIGGYTFVAPPKILEIISDDDMLELAALIIAMKPELKQKFGEILKRIEDG